MVERIADYQPRHVLRNQTREKVTLPNISFCMCVRPSLEEVTLQIVISER